MTRNPNPTWIQDNNESRSSTRNPSLITIHDVAKNPNPKRIQDIIRNHNPPRIEESMTYNGCHIRTLIFGTLALILHFIYIYVD